LPHASFRIVSLRFTGFFFLLFLSVAAAGKNTCIPANRVATKSSRNHRPRLSPARGLAQTCEKVVPSGRSGYRKGGLVGLSEGDQPLECGSLIHPSKVFGGFLGNERHLLGEVPGVDDGARTVTCFLEPGDILVDRVGHITDRRGDGGAVVGLQGGGQVAQDLEGVDRAREYRCSVITGGDVLIPCDLGVGQCAVALVRAGSGKKRPDRSSFLRTRTGRTPECSRG